LKSLLTNSSGSRSSAPVITLVYDLVSKNALSMPHCEGIKEMIVIGGNELFI